LFGLRIRFRIGFRIRVQIRFRIRFIFTVSLRYIGGGCKRSKRFFQEKRILVLCIIATAP